MQCCEHFCLFWDKVSSIMCFNMVKLWMDFVVIPNVMFSLYFIMLFI
jgi:hypothetical protein